MTSIEPNDLPKAPSGRIPKKQTPRAWIRWLIGGIVFALFGLTVLFPLGLFELHKWKASQAALEQGSENKQILFNSVYDDGIATGFTVEKAQMYDETGEVRGLDYFGRFPTKVHVYATLIWDGPAVKNRTMDFVIGLDIAKGEFVSREMIRTDLNPSGWYYQDGSGVLGVWLGPKGLAKVKLLGLLEFQGTWTMQEDVILLDYRNFSNEEKRFRFVLKEDNSLHDVDSTLVYKHPPPTTMLEQPGK